MIGLAAAVLVVVCLVPLETTVEPLEPRASTRYWQMSGGYRIAYTRLPAAVPADRPPVVFLHGGPGGYVHSSILRTLGPLTGLGHDLVFYDQVGSGLSDRLRKPKDYTFGGHLADLGEIVDRHLGAERVVLVGQSYGGILAAHFLARHPERLAGVVLTSPGVLQPSRFDEEGRWVNEALYPVPDHLRFEEPTDVSHIWGVRHWPPRAIATVALATAFNVKLMSDAEADGFLNDLISRFSKGLVCDEANVRPEEGGGGLYAHGWSGWFGGVEDPRERLRRAEVPLLVLQGQCDFIPYAAAFEYADLVPGGEYRFVEGAGHEIWWDRPQRFRREIRRFLESLPVDTPASLAVPSVQHQESSGTTHDPNPEELGNLGRTPKVPTRRPRGCGR